MIFSIENPMPQGHHLIPFLMQQIFSFPETYIFQFQPGLHDLPHLPILHTKAQRQCDCEDIELTIGLQGR